MFIVMHQIDKSTAIALSTNKSNEVANYLVQQIFNSIFLCLQVFNRFVNILNDLVFLAGQIWSQNLILKTRLFWFIIRRLSKSVKIISVDVLHQQVHFFNCISEDLNGVIQWSEVRKGLAQINLLQKLCYLVLGCIFLLLSFFSSCTLFIILAFICRVVRFLRIAGLGFIIL